MPHRRQLIKSAAGLALISAVPSLWGSRAAAASMDDLVAAAKAAGQMKVVLAIGGGEYLDNLKEFFFDPFTKETGIELTFVSGPFSERIAKLNAMSETNTIEWDIVNVPSETLGSPEVAKYIDNLNNCSELPSVASEGMDGACVGDAVLSDPAANGIAYDESVFQNGGMKSWADFWDVKTFPGPRSLPNYGSPWYVLAAALLADGVDAKDVYPLDVDRAFKKLDQLKPHVAVWWTSGNQSQQILRTKEVVAAMVWNGRAASLRKEGLPISFVWNGAMLEANALAIIKGAPHPKAARALLNYLYTRPDAVAEYAKRMNYALPLKRAADFMDADVKSSVPTAPQNWSQLVKPDVAWIADNRQKLIERWAAWISG